MAKVTREQLNKWNEGAGNGFKVDLQMLMFHGEKMLEYVGEKRADKTHFVVSLRFVDETIGKGWTAKRTGKQLLTVRVARYIPITDDGLCQVDFGVYEEVIGEPQNRKMFSYMQKMSHKVNLAEILEKAEKARPIEGEVAKEIEPQNIMDFIEEETEEQEENEEMKENIVDEEMKISEGMTFVDGNGMVFTVTRLTEMNVDLNNGEQSIYDFGTSRTVGAILEALGKGSSYLPTDETQEQPEEAQPQEISTERETEPETTTTSAEPAEVGEISTEGTETTEEPTTAEAFPDMFAELAKAYITGKQAPKKPHAAPKVEKLENKPQEEEKPQEKPINIIGEVSRHDGIAVYYATHCLNMDILAEIKEKADRYIIISNAAFLSDERMEEYKISFLHIGYDIKPEEIGKLSHKEYLKRAGIESTLGFTGEPSELFTPDQITSLETGEQVEVVDRYKYHSFYFSTPYRDNRAKMVFCLSSGQCEEIRAGYGASYEGFILDGKYYRKSEEIRKEAYADITEKIRHIIPDEEVARVNAGELSDYQKEKFENMAHYDYMSDARGHFYRNTEPELQLYHPYNKLNENEIIEYMLNPSDFVRRYAEEYTQERKIDICEDYIRYNRIMQALNVIKENLNNEEHQNKEIMDKIGDQKTVKVTLANGETVKVEARAVKNIGYHGYISTWDVIASDRGFLDKDERGRAQEIKTADIKQITHGGRILYSAA